MIRGGSDVPAPLATGLQTVLAPTMVRLPLPFGSVRGSCESLDLRRTWAPTPELAGARI